MYYALVSLTAASLAVTCTDVTWILSMFFGKIFAGTLRVKHLVPQGLEWMTTIPTAVNKPVTIEKLAFLILSVVSLSYDTRPAKTYPPLLLIILPLRYAVCGIFFCYILRGGDWNCWELEGVFCFPHHNRCIRDQFDSTRSSSRLMTPNAIPPSRVQRNCSITPMVICHINAEDTSC